MGIKKV